MNNLLKILTGISRVFVGILFILSGFIKANDPIGFGYKLAEYFEVFGTQIFIPMAAFIAMAICIAEILLGVWLLLGYKKKFTIYSLLAMIVFFTFLTFYSAYYNKVTDCGCFGDALHLTPWQSFTKDIILLVLILILLRGQAFIQPILSQSLRNGIAYISVIITAMFTFFCYYYLPMIDFRPYAVGKDWVKQMEVPPGSPTDSFTSTFVYEKDGKQVLFSMADLMTVKDLASYKFVSTDTKKVREGYKPPIHDFSLSNLSGNSIKDSFLAQKGYRLLVVQYDLAKADRKGQEKVNALIKELPRKVAVWGLTASSSTDINNYRMETGTTYPFYTGDGTMLKTIVRSNPALVLMKDNTALKMYPSTNVPSIADIKNFITE